IVQRLRQHGVNLMHNIQKRSMGQLARAGAQLAILPGHEPDDERVEGWWVREWCVHRMMASDFIRSRILKATLSSASANQAPCPVKHRYSLRHPSAKSTKNWRP